MIRVLRLLPAVLLAACGTAADYTVGSESEAATGDSVSVKVRPVLR